MPRPLFFNTSTSQNVQYLMKQEPHPTPIDPKLEPQWKEVLKDEFNAPYFVSLRNFLIAERAHHHVYPSGSNIFAAFNHTPFDRVKVVILGQDPYHGAGQAHGLSFSVPAGVRKPPSLVNIHKELCNDLNIPEPGHGNLTGWARQGVLLLNATLTVRANEAASHQGKGWETFTDQVIRALSERRQHLVFMLWGNPAGQKAVLIDRSRHLILQAPHPSPLSAYRGFFGSRHFSAANAYLLANHATPIDWEL
jgi:uracil-DNA glycosylase